jgi:predicted transcriptional regulator
MKVTELELKIFRIIWNLGNSATVQEVLDNWEGESRPQYTTVLKVLQILEDKKLVTHKKEGRAYKYIPAVSKSKFLKFNIKDLIKNFFNEDNLAFAQNFISKTKFSPEEIKSLKKLIQEKEKEQDRE